MHGTIPASQHEYSTPHLASISLSRVLDSVLQPTKSCQRRRGNGFLISVNQRSDQGARKNAGRAPIALLLRADITNIHKWVDGNRSGNFPAPSGNERIYNAGAQFWGFQSYSVTGFVLLFFIICA